MILQNLTKAFRQQNWFAVAVEFLIVIVGVVIGFQINAWNAGRSEQAAAQAYLDRIAADLQADASRLDAAILRFLESAAAARKLMEYHESSELPPSDYGVALFQVMWWEPHQPSYPSLDALVGAGDLGLIRDDDLVTRLMDIQSSYDLVYTAQEHIYREIDAYIYEEYVDRVSYEAGLAAYRSDTENAPIDPAAFEAIRDNMCVENGLILIAHNYDYLADILMELRTDVNEAHERIEAGA